jgi:hypothetical protein
MAKSFAKVMSRDQIAFMPSPTLQPQRTISSARSSITTREFS